MSRDSTDPKLTDRMWRQIERLLDEADEAARQLDWATVRARANAVLTIHPNNADALTYLAASERAASESPSHEISPGAADSGSAVVTSPAPTFFCDGRYEVVRFLGEGGKKRVYLCHDAKLDRDVAFALIKTEGLDAEGHGRIQREAQAMGRLGDHPHIVPVHDLGDENGQPYLVSQLMTGGDVEGLIERAEGHRLPLDQALSIADQVCQALEHAHTHGIIHRDLKPGNVWLTGNGTAKLGDFGLAVALGRTRLTQAGMMVGTVAYMPPEQATGGDVTQRSDLYSLGAMLYEMVCGRTPFVGEESVAVIGQHLNTPPVAPTWHRPDCPPGLEALILRLLEKDPGKRPQSAAEVRQAVVGVRGQGSGDGRQESPTPYSRLPTPADNPLYRRTFVGRENELQQLRAGFDGAASGQGGLVMVVGEPGIGKTALIEQLATYAGLRGGTALIGHCYEEGSLSLPYLPFVEALRSYVLAREPDRLRDELGSGAADVARIISEVRDRVQVEQRPPGDPEDDRWRLFQGVTGFLRNASSVQPILLVVEDLHWADRGTLDYLIHLARNLAGARLFVVGSYRDVEVDRAHPLSNALAELRRAGELPRVLLRGLTVDEVNRMINALQGQNVRWSLAEAVHRQTEGSPLFIQEVLRYLVEEGLIVREEGRWRRAGETAPELSIPEGLRDVIGKRLSRLSPDCNRLLTVAAVIGREFGLDVLGKVSQVSEDDALAALEEGLKVGVLEEKARAGTVLYRFAHAFFRQTLYEEVSAARRIRLHQEVGRALEAVHTRRLEDHAAELAEHFSHSSDPTDLTKAAQYGELGARRAIGVYAYGEAVRLVERALEVQEVLDPADVARRCELLLELGEALGPAGDPTRAHQEVAPEAFALAERLDNRANAFRACRIAIEGMQRSGGGAYERSPEFGQWAERADRYAAPGTIERVQADMALVNHMAFTGRRGVVWDRVHRALALARELGETEALYQCAIGPLIWLSWLRHGEETLELAEELVSRPREGVKARTLGMVLWYSALLYLDFGQRERAETLTREVAELADRTREAGLLWRPPWMDVILATLDGRLEDAVDAADRFLARAEEVGAGLQGRIFATGSRLYAHLYLGRAEEVFPIVEDISQRGTAMGGELPLCLAHLGRPDEAKAALDHVISYFRLHPDDEPVAQQAVELLQAAIVLEDREATAYLAELMAGHARRLAAGTATSATCVARHLGAAAALLGDPAAAREHYATALEVCAQVRFRPELALTRLQLAELLLEHYPDERADALDHLDFAIEELRAMKMQPALERALRHKGLLRA
jgi:tetratricopeptide (TPR) repeat protein